MASIDTIFDVAIVNGVRTERRNTWHPKFGRPGKATLRAAVEQCEARNPGTVIESARVVRVEPHVRIEDCKVLATYTR